MVYRLVIYGQMDEPLILGVYADHSVAVFEGVRYTQLHPATSYWVFEVVAEQLICFDETA